jgi:hypothetical protein
LVKHRESKTCGGESTKQNVVEENQNELNNICKGCQKEFKRLIPHLNSKSGSKCKEHYDIDELIKDNKAKLLEKKRKHYEENKEEIQGIRKTHYTEHQADIKLTRQELYKKNEDRVKLTRQEHYKKNEDKINSASADGGPCSRVCARETLCSAPHRH